MTITAILKMYMVDDISSGNAKYFGNGLIGSAFKRHGILHGNSIVIAKGVSNSQESRNDEFDRELSLIQDCYDVNGPDVKYIIMSSCSIPHIVSPYVLHKLNIENYVKNNFKRFMIYRLPQVVGITNNTTIVSYLVRKIMLGESIEIQKHAMRQLVDVDDIPRIINACEKPNVKSNSVINISHGMMISAYDLVMKISKIINRTPIYTFQDSGVNYELPKDDILKIVLGRNDIFFQNTYTKNILSKYVPLMIARYVE